MTEPREPFTIVDRRGVAIERTAFPRDPSLVEPSNGPAGAVGPDSPATLYGATADAEPVIVDGDEFDAALPGPRLTPTPWAGWPSQWQPAWGNGGGGAGLGGLGRQVSTVFSCTALNANALASMPVSLTEAGRPLDPLLYEWTENPEPRLYSGIDEFLTQAVVSILTRGDLYIAPTHWEWETLLPDRFMVVDPDRVTCRFALDGATRDYWINGEPLMPGDLLHTRYMSAAGWPTGLSPLQAAAGNLRSAGALEQYGAQIAESGGIPWGTLTTDERLTRRQRAIARQEWIEAQANRMGGPAIFGQGLKLDTLSINPKDMALLDLRVFDEQRIAAAFGVPPFLIGLPQPEGLTYANATSMYDAHWRQMLRPLARKIMGALSSWALPRGQRVHLNAGDYVQPSLPERTTAYKEMHDAGALTVDEWRALEGLPPLTAGQRASRALAEQTADSAVTQ